MVMGGTPFLPHYMGSSEINATGEAVVPMAVNASS
jgi:hypothetical protein